MPLEINLGHASRTGHRERNEDFCGIVTPRDEQLEIKGIVAAVADGVSGSGGGREAAEYAVRGLLSDYYATPDTWEISFALDKVLSAINRWMIAQGNTHREWAGMATTLSLLVLRGQRYFLAHVGDTRVYLFRNGKLQQLTIDHVWDRPDMQHVLKRAVGLDQHLRMDYSDDELKVGDVFLLLSDGVWQVLSDARLKEVVSLSVDSQVVAEALLDEALNRNTQDNVTAMVIRVDALPAGNQRDLFNISRQLPVPERLKPTQVIDHFEVIEVLHESRATLLYKVKDRLTQQILVLKTLQPLMREDIQSCEALLAEEWLAKRVVAHYFPQITPLTTDRRFFLYYVMAYHEGNTLQDLINADRHFSIAESVQIGIRLAKAIGALHRLNIIHRDIKPANIHLGNDNKLRILDLGVALNTGAIHEERRGNVGTPSFIAPELFSDGTASMQSDLYAVGVTLYYVLTRKYPYGEIEPFQHPRFGEPVTPTRYRPDIPQWLENIILKAVAKDPKNRFETAEELLLALERGERLPINGPQRVPLIERNALRFWQSVALISLVLNILLFYMMLVT